MKRTTEIILLFILSAVVAYVVTPIVVASTDARSTEIVEQLPSPAYHGPEKPSETHEMAPEEGRGVVDDYSNLITAMAALADVDADLALRIIACESNFVADATNDNYLEDGTLWSTDWGYWQINDYYHLGTAQEMNLSIIDSPLDNLLFGFLLLKRDGAMQHWSASSPCWNVIA